MPRAFRVDRGIDFLKCPLTRMLDFPNVAQELFGAIGLLRFEDLSHVLENSSRL